MASPLPTEWAVICPHHGQVFLTEKEYVAQLSNPDTRWLCPHCGTVADYDDENDERWAEEHDAGRLEDALDAPDSGGRYAPGSDELPELYGENYPDEPFFPDEERDL